MRWLIKILSSFVLLFLIAFSVTATIPLRFIVDSFPNMPLPVTINRVQGTVLHGHVSLQLHNLPIPPPLSSKMSTLDIAWQWCPSLNIGLSAMCIETESELFQGAFTSIISTSEAALYDASLLSEIQRLPLSIAGQPTEISGTLQLYLSHFAMPLAASFPKQIHGEILLNNIAIGIFELGNFRFDLSTDADNKLNAAIHGSGELFKAQGIASLSKEKQYQYNIRIESEHAMVVNFLSSYAQKNRDGSYKLTKSGTLSAL